MFGKAYKEYLYFGHALEVLLHEAVEDQKDTPSGMAILQKTIQFIEQFPQFLDVVMSVARKTEADSWNYFFTFAGNPQELFEVCRILPSFGYYRFLMIGFSLFQDELGNRQTQNGMQLSLHYSQHGRQICEQEGGDPAIGDLIVHRGV